MIGGNICAIYHEIDHIEITVQGTGVERNDFTRVHIQLTDEPLAVGDSFWWHSDKCCWTPQDQSRVDVNLLKISPSYTPQALR